jgi:hypothetical protein
LNVHICLSETRNIINEKFWEELIAYFLCYDTDRTENKKIWGLAQIYKQQGDFMSLPTKIGGIHRQATR